jgi:hypothetical protein
MTFWHVPLIHRPTKSKLVGLVFLGRWDEPVTPNIVHQLIVPRISITNPNCADQISITQVSLIKQETGGPRVIYEGPFLRTPQMDTRVVVETLAPHATFGSQLRFCIPVSPPPATAPAYGFPDPTIAAHWLTGQQAITQDIASFCIEIEWWAGRDVYPPIAMHIEEHLRMNANYTTIISTGQISAHFVNLKQ